MDLVTYKKRLQSLLEQDIDEVSWQEKVEVVGEILARSSKTDDLSNRRDLKNRNINISHLFIKAANFVRLLHVLARTAWKNSKVIPDELLAKMIESLDKIVEIESNKAVLNVLFPKGHIKLFRTYNDYNRAVKFRKRMECANELLLQLKVYGKLGILDGFNDFIANFRNSLISDVETRARSSNAKIADLDNEIIPNEYNLRIRFKEALEKQHNDGVRI